MTPTMFFAGLELLKTLKSSSEKENHEKVKEVLSRVESAKPFWKSKRFWMTAAGVLIPVVNKITGLGLSESEIIPIIGAIAAYVLGKSHEQKG